MSVPATAVKERPILFSGEMARAILEGRKTQTRRIVKRKDGFVPEDFYDGLFWFEDGGHVSIECPYGKPGDRLWVKETFAIVDGRKLYAADQDSTPRRWKSPLFLPRWASRITLEIVSVRVERVQEISLQDVLAEGVSEKHSKEHGDEYWRENTGADFIDIWNSINAKRGFGWEKNPWVWVIEFKKLEAE